jgi:hypothetical protein
MHEFNRDDTFNQRLLQEFYDSYDEELEMELDDLRFDDAEVDSDQKKAWRKQYFRELLHLQGAGETAGLGNAHRPPAGYHLRRARCGG